MSPDVAIRVVSADLPCHHDNFEETSRSQWVHCIECNMPIHVDELEDLQQHALQFREAIRVLTELVQASARKRKPRTSPTT